MQSPEASFWKGSSYNVEPWEVKPCKMVRWPLEAEWARSEKAWSLALRLEVYHSGKGVSKGASNIHFVLIPKGRVSEYNGWPKWRPKLIMKIVECIWTLGGEKLDILGKPRELNNYCKCYENLIVELLMFLFSCRNKNLSRISQHCQPLGCSHGYCIGSLWTFQIFPFHGS